MDESWDLPHINDERCNLCGVCVELCRRQVLALGENAVVLTRPEACDCCGTCEEVCPEDAIDCAFEIVWEDDNAT